MPSDGSVLASTRVRSEASVPLRSAATAAIPTRRVPRGDMMLLNVSTGPLADVAPSLRPLTTISTLATGMVVGYGCPGGGEGGSDGGGDDGSDGGGDDGSDGAGDAGSDGAEEWGDGRVKVLLPLGA